MRAVSRCFDWSGFDWMTAAEWVSLPWDARYSLTCGDQGRRRGGGDNSNASVFEGSCQMH